MAGLILIVDDDLPIFEAIATALSFQGYDTRAAGNGQEALAAIDVERPALILLDLHMPVLDGEGLLCELAVRGIKVPVVLMSGDDEAEDVARQHGVAAYLKKPIAIPRLLAAVAACGSEPPKRGQRRRAA